MNCTFHIDESGAINQNPPEPLIVGGFTGVSSTPEIPDVLYDSVLAKVIKKVNHDIPWTKEFRRAVRSRMKSEIRSKTEGLIHQEHFHFKELAAGLFASNCQQNHEGVTELRRYITKLIREEFLGLPFINLSPAVANRGQDLSWNSMLLDVIIQGASRPGEYCTVKNISDPKYIVAHRYSSIPLDAILGSTPSAMQQALNTQLVSLKYESKSKGLQDQILVLPAKAHSGLLLADFCCGLARQAIPFRSQELPVALEIGIGVLEAEGYKILRHTDRPWMRQAKAASIDGDHARSLFLHLSNSSKDIAGMRRAFDEMIHDARSRGFEHNAEALVEHMDRWASRTGRRQLSNGLNLLLSLLAEKCTRQDEVTIASIRRGYIRIGSHALALANHLGDVKLPSQFIELLDELRDVNDLDGTNFESLCLADVGTIETALNSHEFDIASKVAEQHLEFVMSKGQLNREDFQIQNDLRAFQVHYIARAWTTYYRAKLLKLCNQEQTDYSAINDILEIICTGLTTLAPEARKSAQLMSLNGRWIHLKVFALEHLLLNAPSEHHAQMLRSAVEMCISILGDNSQSSFVRASLGRALSIGLILGLLDPGESSVILVTNREWISNELSSNQSLRHPLEMICRDFHLCDLAGFSSIQVEQDYLRSALEKWSNLRLPNVAVFKHQQRLTKTILERESEMQQLSVPEQSRMTRAADHWPKCDPLLLRAIAVRGSTVY